MNALQGVLIAATVVVAGVGPFIAVHIGGKAFDDDDNDHDEPEPHENDDTTHIPRVTDQADPYSY